VSIRTEENRSSLDVLLVFGLLLFVSLRKKQKEKEKTQLREKMRTGHIISIVFYSFLYKSMENSNFGTFQKNQRKIYKISEVLPNNDFFFPPKLSFYKL